LTDLAQQIEDLERKAVEAYTPQGQEEEEEEEEEEGRFRASSSSAKPSGFVVEER
jgi:hypothetical protein